MPSRKSDKINSTSIILIKVNIKINIIKIYINNTHIVTITYNITRIFVKIEYILNCIQSSKKILIILLVINQSGISFNVVRESSTLSSHIFWVIYLSGQYTIKEGSFRGNSIIHFWSFILIRNRIWYKKASFNCFITHCLSHKALRSKSFYKRIGIDSFIIHFL